MQKKRNIEKLVGKDGYSLEAVYQRVAQRTASVEIALGDRVQEVRFYLDTHWKKCVSKAVKEDVIWNVERTSLPVQLQNFSQRAQTIIADFNSRRRKKLWMKRFVLTRLINTEKWSLLMLFFSFAINIVMVVGWSSIDDNYVPVYYYPELTQVMSVLGIAHLVCNSFQLLSYCIDTLSFESNKGPASSERSDVDVLRYIMEFRLIGNHHKTVRPFFNARLAYYSFLVVLSVIGNMYGGYTFCIHLLHVVHHNETLAGLIDAITRQTKPLGAVALMLLLIIYIYSVVAFVFMGEYFDNSAGDYCNNMAQCFLTSIRLGLLNGGGLGEALAFDTATPVYSFTEPAARTFFDVSFYTIIVIIGLNVVFGIIVESFQELRDERNRLTTAMSGGAAMCENGNHGADCFMCGIDHGMFDRDGNGWELHRKHEHNMWHYIAFFIYLDSKQPTEFSDVEYRVAEKMIKNEHDFFPNHAALCLEKHSAGGAGGAGEGASQSLEDRMGLLEQTVQAKFAAVEGMLSQLLLHAVPSARKKQVQKQQAGESFGFGNMFTGSSDEEDTNGFN